MTDILEIILIVGGVSLFLYLHVKYGNHTTNYNHSSNDDLSKIRQIEEYNRIEKLTKDINNDK